MVKTGIALGTVLVLALATWTGFRVAGRADQVLFTESEIPLKTRAWPNSPDEVTFVVIGDAGTGGPNQYRVARGWPEHIVNKLTVIF